MDFQYLSISHKLASKFSNDTSLFLKRFIEVEAKMYGFTPSPFVLPSRFSTKVSHNHITIFSAKPWSKKKKERQSAFLIPAEGFLSPSGGFPQYPRPFHSIRLRDNSSSSRIFHTGFLSFCRKRFSVLRLPPALPIG